MASEGRSKTTQSADDDGGMHGWLWDDVSESHTDLVTLHLMACRRSFGLGEGNLEPRSFLRLWPRPV